MKRQIKTVEAPAAEPEDDTEYVEEACVACDGPLIILGCLGNTAHFRCRNCGTEIYRRAQT